MGCFDMYCDVCSAPFVSYNSWTLPNMEGIDTDWLTEAEIHYYTTNTKVGVVYYDGYGSFEEANGTEHDVVVQVYEKTARVYHKLCANRKMTSDNIKTMSSYKNDQFFKIDEMIKDGNQSLLIAPSAQ